MSWLWDELRDQFEVDDGGLYDIRVDFAEARCLVAAFRLLRDRGVLNPGATFWSVSEQRDVPVPEVEDAAALVVAREAEPFHVVFSGLGANGVAIPDLGAFVFQEQLALDYRMGPEWNPATLQGLFHLLLELSAPDPGAKLSLEEGVLPEVASRFDRCWRRFCEPSAA